MATNALREILREASSLQDLDFDYPTANYFGPSPRVDELLDAILDEKIDDEDEAPKVALPRALREITVP